MTCKVLIFLTLSAAFASAQSKTLVAAQLLAEAVDAYATHRNSVRVNFHETDPIARPFVTHGTPLLAGYFAADVALKIGAEYWLTRHHHEKLARVIGWVGAADSAWGAESSFRGYRP